MGDFYVRITDPERSREFEGIFGTAEVPVKSLQPVIGNAPGMKNKPFYILDIWCLSYTEYAKLAHHLAEKFSLPIEETYKELNKNGCPILAEHCSIVVRNPQRWLS